MLLKILFIERNARRRIRKLNIQDRIPIQTQASNKHMSARLV